MNKPIEQIIEELPDGVHLFMPQMPPKVSQMVCTTDDLKALVAELEQRREREKRYEAALRYVFDIGHNLECLFCGFKDKAALKALKENE